MFSTNFFRHREKPEISIIPNLRNHEAIRFVLSDVAAYKSKLELIFKNACTCVYYKPNASQNVLPKDRYMKLLDHFQLFDQYLTPEDAEYIYELISMERKMEFDVFCIAIHDLACRKYIYVDYSGEDGAQKHLMNKVAAMKKMVATMFSMNIAQVYFQLVCLVRWKESAAIERQFWKYEKVLKNVYQKFAKVDESEGISVLTFQKFLSFCSEFRLYPNKISQLEIQRIFGTFGDRSDPTTLSLNYETFLDAIARVAITLFSKPKYQSSHSTPEEQVSAFFQAIEGLYEDIINRTVEDDLADLSSINPPSIFSISPEKSPCEGKVTCILSGNGFDQRLGGIYVKFGDLPIKCRFISPEEIECKAPPVAEIGSKVRIHIDLETVSKDYFRPLISNRSLIKLYATNDGEKCSKKSIDFEYVDHMDPFFLQPQVIEPLRVIFEAFCKLDDQYNDGYLSLTKWKLFKYSLSQMKKLKAPEAENILETGYQSDESKTDKNSVEFYRFCIVKGTKRVLGFENFLQSLMYYVLLKMENLHPLDFLVDLVINKAEAIPKSKKKQSAHNEAIEKELLREANLILTHPFKIFDIYRGPILIGTVTDQPGKIRDRCHGSRIPDRPHKSIDYYHYDIHTKTLVFKMLEFKGSFDNFLRRLLESGFDMAASIHEDGEPVLKYNSAHDLGRCWSIHRNTDHSTKIGMLWDKPGTFCTKTWCPRVKEFSHSITMICYDQSEFYTLFRLYRKSQSIADMRQLLVKYGFWLRTQLYTHL